MKKLIIAGSSKLQERAAYWRGYFEGRGYEIIDYPTPISDEGDYAENLTDIYISFFQNLDRADVFFLMNEDKDNIGGYIGPSAFSELTYVIIGNLNRGKKVEINLLQMPSEEQACYEEVKFWLDQNWIQIYERPTGKKAVLPVEAPVETATEIDDDDAALEAEFSDEVEAAPAIAPPEAPSLRHKRFGRNNEKTINILTCKKRCLKRLTPAQREYLQTLAPEFPAWLLKYIAAPEMQRLRGVSMASGTNYSGLYNFPNFNSVFLHSIGVALIVWRFTHDKKQTLAGLFHDIASPAFKHCIDVMHGDGEKQESTEERTSEIIRNSRVITRQLKRDEIMPGEVSDYKLYPIADNEGPQLAADRFEYTLSNGYFLYEAWMLDQIKKFSDNLTILKNEHDIEELGFRDFAVAKEFTLGSLPLFHEYRSDNARAILQFIADIVKSMDVKGYLTEDDLYAMSEREIIDWILSCGDRTISEAFRNFQRSTSIYTGNTAKKDRYCTNLKTKQRYVDVLVAEDEKVAKVERVSERSLTVRRAIEKFLANKGSKYVGFDFEFTPYDE